MRWTRWNYADSNRENSPTSIRNILFTMEINIPHFRSVSNATGAEIKLTLCSFISENSTKTTRSIAPDYPRSRIIAIYFLFRCSIISVTVDQAVIAHFRWQNSNHDQQQDIFLLIPQLLVFTRWKQHTCRISYSYYQFYWKLPVISNS